MLGCPQASAAAADLRWRWDALRAAFGLPPADPTAQGAAGPAGSSADGGEVQSFSTEGGGGDVATRWSGGGSDGGGSGGQDSSGSGSADGAGGLNGTTIAGVVASRLNNTLAKWRSTVTEPLK